MPALWRAAPSAWTLLWGVLIAAPALLLRAWAFAHLGGQGRTRDPAPPTHRVRSGPYARLHHPVYLANVLLAAGMLAAAGLPRSWALALLVGVLGFYGLLAWRESAQLPGLPVAAPRVTWARVARWERSTWITTALWFTLLGLRCL